ncbi:MAG: transglutaminase-like domain-containing protein, partial [Notoacmeibacter sp.]
MWKLNRRLLLTGAFAAGAMMTMGNARSAELIDPLAPTALIDSDHAKIVGLAQRLAPNELPKLEKVKRIFVFVRDEIKFGFGPRFYEHTASEVAEMRLGYCNTKGTLMVALLRAAGIPARQVFVDIDAQILRGIVDPGTLFVDHSYVELLLDDVWLATDA